MESNCEPPYKKLCLSQDDDAHPNSRSAGGSSLTRKESPVASASADAYDPYGEGIDSDEFESLEELITASQNIQATMSAPETRHLSSVSSTGEVNLAGAKVKATQHGHSTSAAGLATEAVSVSHTEADLELPSIDSGEESDSMVIDLTRDDTELRIGRSDGFVGVIKPGTPGVTVKREGRFKATPTRHTLAPLPTNTASHRLRDQKPIQPVLTPESRHAKSIKSEDAENSMPPLTYTPNGLKHEYPATPTQGYAMGLFKAEHEDKRPNRRKRAADGSPKLTSSPGVDLTKFLANEQNLASMPRAPQVPQLKTKLLDHQRQVFHTPHSTRASFC